MPLVPARCPECGGNINIDPSQRLGICEYCKAPFVVQEAIQNFNTTYNITNNNEIKADVVNVYESKNNDFEIEAGLLKKYKGSSTQVVIPEGVREIGPQAFAYQKWLEQVVIPEGVCSIQKCAFADCKRLKNIRLPSSLELVDEEAFLGCNISEIDVPDSVDEEIYLNAFQTLFQDRITFKRKEALEKVKRKACGDVSKEFGENYNVVTLDEVLPNCIELKTPELRLVFNFITGDDNPISTDVIAKEGLKVGTILYHSDKVKDDSGDSFNEWSGYRFLGLYGHYFAFMLFSYSLGWSDETQYIGYYKECFTDQNDVINYIQDKQQEFLKKCKSLKICPYCGEKLSILNFGMCNNEHCKKKYKQYWTAEKFWNRKVQ